MSKIKSPQIALLVFFLVSLVYLFQSCKKDSTLSSEEDHARVNVYLMDGPGDFNQVNVEVDSVLIHSDQTGWVNLNNINAVVYNLLDFIK